MALRGETIGAAFIRILADGSDFEGSAQRALKQSEAGMQRAGERHNDRFTEGWENGSRKNRRKLGREFLRTIEGVGDDIDTNLSKKLGKAFGKGSRNNFLNLVGSVVQGLTSIAGKAVAFAARMGETFVDLGSKIFNAFGKATEGAEDLAATGGKGLSQLATTGEEAAASIAASGPPGWIAFAAIVGGLIVAAPILVGALGTITAAVLILLGGVTALIGAITIGLIGAIAPLVGAVLPLAVVAGTIALIVSGLSKKPPKGIAEQIKSISNSFKALGKVASTGFFKGLGDGISNLAGAFKTLTPLVRVVSTLIGEIAGDFADALNSPGFKTWVATVTEFLPGQIRSLGGIIQNAFGAIGGLFIALEPVTTKFLERLEGLTANFSDWVNSAGGTSKLQDFFAGAFETADKLWDITKQLFIDIGKLFGAGQSQGNDLLDSLLGQLTDFGDWLSANPDALKTWFNNGKDAIRKVGDIVKRVIEFIDDLDTPQNRENAMAVFRAIENGVRLAKIAIAVLTPAWNAMTAPIQGIAILVRATLRTAADLILIFTRESVQLFGKMIEPFAAMPGKFGAPFRTLKAKLDQTALDIDKVKAKIDSALGNKKVNIDVDTSGVPKAVTELAKVRWQTDHIPKSVTVGVMSKLGAAGGKVYAAGGLVMQPTRSLLGEAGPEAVVPLNRPLSQVDPAVRQLSAIAQGLGTVGTTNNTGKVINVGGLTVITPTENPAAVAHETVNLLAGASYL